jgi:hypothetical protein
MAHGEVLRQSDECVIKCAVAVWVVLTHDFTDDRGALADIAAKARVTELELLKGATKFCQRHNVHPSPYLQKFAADHAAKKKRGVPGERHDKITADAIL